MGKHKTEGGEVGKRKLLNSSSLHHVSLALSFDSLVSSPNQNLIAILSAKVPNLEEKKKLTESEE